MKKKLTLKDVDGTVPGRASLVYLNLEDPDGRRGLMRTEYVEGEDDCDSPILHCRALHESIRYDWPEHEYAIIANARARYLEWRRDMIALLGDRAGTNTPADYLEIIK